jgi:molybdate transport system substrate-binding protein
MNRRRLFTFIGLMVATAVSLTVGTTFLNQRPQIADANSKILISAAASLKESIADIQPAYSKAKRNITVNYNFGASGALQKQIENGAPADVFISAGKKQMDALQSKGLIITETRRNLLNNRLVLIVPQKAAAITSFEELTNSKVKKIAIGEPRSVPAGQYAEEVLKNLKILSEVKPKFVLANNVRQVLSAVETGNADAGIVYLTDAKTSKKVKVVVTAAENLHSPIVYPVAVLKTSKNVPAAKDYVQFLSSNEARVVFEQYGFGMAR